MKVKRCFSGASDIVSGHEYLAANFANETPALASRDYAWLGAHTVSKAAVKGKEVRAPYDLKKLMALVDKDEYHAACIRAIVRATLMDFTCTDKVIDEWLNSANFKVDIITYLSGFLMGYLACGNGFLVKTRDRTKSWAGLERLLPHEVRIIEKYDAEGNLAPVYVQVKNNVKKEIAAGDIIHMRQETYLSNCWGISCLPIVPNMAILDEIKTFDHNNFKNGLLIDQMFIVEGGNLQSKTVTDADGKVVKEIDGTEALANALTAARTNKKSHTSIVVETSAQEGKIRVERLRQENKDGGWLKLKKDLREGIFAYHGVPPRVVSQLVSGQLGGDNNSDMLLFYNFRIKPIQNQLARILAREFTQELKRPVSPDAFEFGNLTELFLSADEKLFNGNNPSN